MSNSQSTPLAIIGIGCIFPKADDLPQYWNNIHRKVDAITEIPETHWRIKDYHNENLKARDHTYATRGGFIEPVDFNPMEFAITPNTMEAIDTAQLLGLKVAKKALQDAGYAKRDFARDRASVILGVTGTLELVIPLGARLGHPIWRRALLEAGINGEEAEKVVQKISDSYVDWQESSFPGLLGNVVAGRIANQLDFGGTNCVVDAACASSLSALHLAALELETGRSDIVLTGGVDAFNDIFMYMCFSKTPALSPTGNARPFDLNADGTILGEGLGMVVLKRLDDAEKDGDNIYAVIRSVGSSSDGKGMAVFAPKSGGQVKAMNNAYRLAGIDPHTIELMEAHGTGTKLGDRTELESLHNVYPCAQNKKRWCAIGSVKSQIGHTKAASGAAGIIKAAMALRHKVLPPTIKVERPMERLEKDDSPFYVNRESRPWLPGGNHPRRAAVSSFGFGGSNYHCILEEYGSQNKIAWDPNVELIAFGADDTEQITRQLSVWKNISPKEIAKKAFDSRQKFDKNAVCRLLIAVDENSDLNKIIANAGAMLEKYPEKTWWTIPDGAYYGKGSSGDLAVLFPGQGSQYTGMLRDLLCRFPEANDILDHADQTFDKTGSLEQRLVDYIYPHSVFDKATEQKCEDLLRDTRVAQPALGAMGFGAYKVMDYFGLRPQALAGHSYGELIALCAAQCYSQDEFHLLSTLRGKLMGESKKDLGSMLAVQTPIAQLEKIVEEQGIDLVIANRNAPKQAVLSGATEEIARAEKILTEMKIRNRRLPVSAAFHSPLVADAQKPFAEVLQKIDFTSAQIKVYSNTLGKQYPNAPKQIRETLAKQLASPVCFTEQIEAMYQHGVRTFLEVGPGAKITGLAKSTLSHYRDYRVIAVDSSNGERNGMFDLAKVLAGVAAAGHTIDLAKWNAELQQKISSNGKKPAINIPICGANYTSSKKKTTAPPPKSQDIAAEKQSTGGEEMKQQNKQHGQFAEKKERQKVSAMSGPVTPQSKHVQSAETVATMTIAQKNIEALQTMQEQTASLHRQFLEGQEAALKTFESLLFGQPISQTAADYRPRENIVSNISPSTVPAAPEPEIPSPQVPAPVAVEKTVEKIQPKPVPFGPNTEDVTKVLVEIVAEKTGYPTEMLEPDMNLNSDLGIDSIKRVEILSSLKDKLPEAQSIKSEHMGTLKTLRDIAEFIAAASPQVVSTPSSGPGIEDVTKILVEIVAEKTGYPTEMLEPDMNLNSDLGIDSIKRVEILSSLKDKLPEAQSIKSEHMGTLKTLRDIAEFIATASPQVVSTPSSGPGIEDVTKILVEIVADKTGYPTEMLEPDMNLNSDLGIDSIKRVEILSSLKDKLPEAQSIKSEHMGTLKTLRDIAEFIAAASPQVVSTPSSGPGIEDVTKILVEIVADKTGYPTEMLEPDMNLNSDLGIDSIKRVEILSSLKDKLPEAQSIKSEHMGTLKTLRDIAEFIAGNQDALKSKVKETMMPEQKIEHDAVLERMILFGQKLSAPIAEQPSIAKGEEVWILDDSIGKKLAKHFEQLGYSSRLISVPEIFQEKAPTKLGGLIIPAFEQGAPDQFLKNAFKLLRFVAPGLKKCGMEQGAAFATISFIDGLFGLNGSTRSSNYTGGGLAGLSKTAHREWSEVRCLALDLSPQLARSDKAMSQIVEQILFGKTLEVGLSEEGMFTLDLRQEPIPDEKALSWHKDDVVLVTGGARGVTAECIVHLAKDAVDQKPIFVLLGRSEQPFAEPDWLTSLTVEGQIKKEIVTHAQKKITPKDIEQQYRRFMANREITDTMVQIENAGAKVYYRSVDVRDKKALSKVLKNIRKDVGPIKGLVHGAGVIADRLIEEKTDHEFDYVYDTKVKSIKLLLEFLRKDQLKVLAFFSSSTGRLGRVGQVDYAVANEVLNKLAQYEAKQRCSCRVVSINWGPWDGGMVTPALKKIFEQEGVGVIPVKTGAEYFVRELSGADKYVEVVALAGLNGKSSKKPPVFDGKIVLEKEINVRDFPCLESHVLDGKAVVPAALIIEWLAHGSMHSNPGRVFQGVNDFRIFKGVKLEISESLDMQIRLGSAISEQNTMAVIAELHTSRDKKQWDLNARAQVILGDRPAHAPAGILSSNFSDYDYSLDEIYNDLLFHGPMFHGIKKVEGCSSQGIAAKVEAAPKADVWLKQPLRRKWITDPLAIDSSFQMMILWSLKQHNSGSLPTCVGKYRQFAKFPRSGVRIIIQVTKETAGKAVSNIEFIDDKGKIIATMMDYECIIDSSLKKLLLAIDLML